MLDHPFDVIKNTYLILHLIKLHDDIITEWIQLHLKDEKHLFKFCQCLLNQYIECDDVNSIRRERLNIVYRQLWLLHNLSASSESVIDHTLRKAVLSDDINEPIFNEDLSLYFSSNNVCASNIHPMILSDLFARCFESNDL